MNQDQIDSLVRTLCKIGGGILAAHGAQQMATVINTPDVVEAITGIITAAISIYASHTSNATPTSNTPVVSQPQSPKA
jgi:hypothetical protein